MKRFAIGLLVLLGLAAVGVPLAGWGALAAMILLALGGLAAIVSAEGAARSLFTWGVAALIFAIVMHAVSGALDTPTVRWILFVVAGIAVLMGLGALAVKLFGGAATKTKIPKFPVRERAAVIAHPIQRTPPSSPDRPHAAPSGATISPASTATDDLGIFRRRSS